MTIIYTPDDGTITEIKRETRKLKYEGLLFESDVILYNNGKETTILYGPFVN